jgi:hypothetical protein
VSPTSFEDLVAQVDRLDEDQQQLRLLTDRLFEHLALEDAAGMELEMDSSITMHPFLSSGGRVDAATG